MPTSIRLPVEIERRLDLLAQQTGRSKAFYIREMILKNIEGIENQYFGSSSKHGAYKVNEAIGIYTVNKLISKPLAKAGRVGIIDLIVKNKNKILETCTRYKAKNVRVFGSCARGDYDETSDVDFLVTMPKELSGFDYINALCDLEETLAALLDIAVDVVDEATLKGNKRNKILKEAVVL